MGGIWTTSGLPLEYFIMLAALKWDLFAANVGWCPLVIAPEVWVSLWYPLVIGYKRDGERGGGEGEGVTERLFERGGYFWEAGCCSSGAERAYSRWGSTPRCRRPPGMSLSWRTLRDVPRYKLEVVLRPLSCCTFSTVLAWLVYWCNCGTSPLQALACVTPLVLLLALYGGLSCWSIST